MSLAPLCVAYMPLVDAAPLIVAQEMGFAEAEGLRLDLIAAPSWSSVRDMLAFGRAEAAHLLSPVPIAMAMGLGGVSVPLETVSVLSLNGNVIGVSRALEMRLRAAGMRFTCPDPRAVAAALAAVCPRPLVFGVPFPFSLHVELLRFWTEHSALREIGIEIRTVPPPLMAQALAAGEIDAFCVGEPWGSVAVEQGAGALVLPGQAIWSGAPEKVLAVRRDWAASAPDLLGRLIRAVWQAGRWLARPDSRVMSARILSRPHYLDVAPELIDRALTGHLILSGRGEQASLPDFLCLNPGAAGFSWQAQARWIAGRLHRAHPHSAPPEAGLAGFRPDLYRAHLAPLGLDMSADARPPAGGDSQPDPFFNRRVFDPDAGE